MNQIQFDQDDVLAELHRLDEIDWPPDEIGDRIAAGVITRWRASGGEPSGAATNSGTARSVRNARPLRGRRVGRRTKVLAGSAAACIVLGLVVATGVLGRGSSDSPRRSTRPSVTTSKPPSKFTGPVMQLVDSTSSPFQTVGSGPQSGNLTCITPAICFAQADSAQAVELTQDGGRTWQDVAPLPDGAALQWPLSCPSTAMCMGIATGVASGGATVAVTTDLGASWRIDPVPAPGDWSEPAISEVSCASATACVAQVTGDSSGSQVGTFLATSDGGAAWTVAKSVPPDADVVSWALTCDPSGVCVSIGLGPVTDVTATVVALTSRDGGLTWSSHSSVLPIGKGVLLIQCGDAVHCVAAFPNGTGAMELAATSDAGTSWSSAAAPASWPQNAVSLSCATGTDCYLSVNNPDGSVQNPPVIEATHDGGSTWTALGLPEVDGGPLAIVYPLSCPVAAGCIGVGATPDEFSGPGSATIQSVKAAAVLLHSLRHTSATGCRPGTAECRIGSTTLRCTDIVPFLRSTSPHFRPNSSP